MTRIRLTKKQIIVRVIVLAVLCIAAYTVLCMRACRTWKPAEVMPEYTQVRENPYIDPAGGTQETRILPPEGYTRTEAAEGSFLRFMRQQPVYDNGSMIYAYNGDHLSGANAAAVYTLSVGDEGYQQCADSIIRLWSDYYWSTGQKDKLSYHLSNGFLCDYASWCRGKRVLAFGEWAVWLKLKGYDDSEQSYRNYLMTVMQFAGTLSLHAESQPIAPQDARAGDILCHPGTPGHAVVLVDEAMNAAGERCFLIAQGFIPAQSCHIIAGYGDAQSPWYTEAQLDAAQHDGVISLSSYVFHTDELRRWNEGF